MNNIQVEVQSNDILNTSDSGKKTMNIHNDTEKQQTNIIFNYSSTTLTSAMKKLLNRALNFALLPIKLDITEVLVDFNKYVRALIWHEYWHGKDVDKTEHTQPIFRKQKTNLPKNYTSPTALKMSTSPMCSNHSRVRSHSLIRSIPSG